MTTNKDVAIKKIEKEFEKLSNLVLEQLQLLKSKDSGEIVRQ